MPNQQPDQNPQPEPQRPQQDRGLNDDPAPDLQDIPPPVILANTEGEGDDVAQNENVETEENEGEGNRTADQNYRKGVQKHLETKNVEQEAEEAAEALDDEDERKDLEDAEEAARKGQIH